MADLNKQILNAALSGDISPEQIHAWAKEHRYTPTYVRRHVRNLCKSGCLVRYYVTEKGRALLQDDDQDE